MADREDVSQSDNQMEDSSKDHDDSEKAFSQTSNGDFSSQPQLFPIRLTRSLPNIQYVQKSPSPDMSLSPSPEMSLSPSPEMSLSPSPEMSLNPSPEKRRGETIVGATPPKKRRGALESDSDESVTGNEFRSKAALRIPEVSPNKLQIKEVKSRYEKNEESGSPITSLTPSKIKITTKESIFCKSRTGNEMFKLNRCFPISTADFVDKSSTNLQFQESKTAVDLGESVSEAKPAISILDSLADLNFLAKPSNTDDLHQTGSLMDFPTEEHKTNVHLNISTDASSTSPYKDSLIQGKKLLASDQCFEVSSPEKWSESIGCGIDEASSSNIQPISNPRISTTEDFEPFLKMQKFSSVSSETQSVSNMIHSSTEAQILKSPSKSIHPNPELPLSCNLPEGSRYSITDHQVLEFEASDEKERTDPIRSDSSSQTSKSNAKSKFQISRYSKMFRRSLWDETSKKLPEDRTQQDHFNLFRGFPVSDSNMGLASGNSQEFRLQSDQSKPLLVGMSETLSSNEPAATKHNADAPMQENLNDSLLHRLKAVPISSGDSTSRKPSESPVVMDSPHIDVAEGEPSTSSHQPLVTDNPSADDQFNSSPGVIPPRETIDEATGSKTSSDRSSKFGSEAQQLLLSILEEIMLFNGDNDQWRRIRTQFYEISKLSLYDPTVMSVNLELLWYLAEKETSLWSKNLFLSDDDNATEYDADDAFRVLTSVIISALYSTLMVLENLNFDCIIFNLRNFRNLFTKFSRYWSHNNADVQDEDSRNVNALNELIQRLLVRTETAFQLLLMHIGQNADEVALRVYRKMLSEDDKKYLRREF